MTNGITTTTNKKLIAKNGNYLDVGIISLMNIFTNFMIRSLGLTLCTHTHDVSYFGDDIKSVVFLTNYSMQDSFSIMISFVYEQCGKFK